MARPGESCFAKIERTKRGTSGLTCVVQPGLNEFHSNTSVTDHIRFEGITSLGVNIKSAAPRLLRFGNPMVVKQKN